MGPKNQKVIPVRLKDEPATGNLVFTKPGGIFPAINNRDEIALVGQVHTPNGPSGYGLFFLGQDSVLRPVVLPGDLLPVAASGPVKAVTDEVLPAVAGRQRQGRLPGPVLRKRSVQRLRVGVPGRWTRSSSAAPISAPAPRSWA